jgi:hypothetical protein
MPNEPSSWWKLRSLRAPVAASSSSSMTEPRRLTASAGIEGQRCTLLDKTRQARA